MIKIEKKNYRNVKYKGNIAELYICNFNGEITYKYVDKINPNIRSSSHTNISNAVREIRSEYRKREMEQIN